MPEGIGYISDEDLLSRARAAGMAPDEQQEMLEIHRANRIKAMHAQAQRQYPITSQVGSLVSAGMNYGNSVIPGVALRGAAALTAPLTAIRRDIGLGEAYDRNMAAGRSVLGASPTSQVVGETAAMLNPNSPVNFMLGKAFNAAGGTKLAEMAAKAAETSTVKGAALQLASALSGSAGVIGASNAMNAALGERDISTIVGDTLSQIASPSNLLLAGGTAGIATAFRAVPAKAKLELIERAKKILPDFKATPDMLREEGGFLSGLVNSLAWHPAGRRIATNFMREHIYTPINKALETMQLVTYARAPELAVEATGKRLRGLMGDAPGSFGSRIERAGKRGFEAAEQAGDTVSLATMQSLRDTIAKFNARAAAAAGTEGARGADMTRIVDQIEDLFQKASKGELTIKPQMLDNLRQALAPIAGFDGRGMPQAINEVISLRDARDARRLYRSIRIAEQQSSPSIDRALNEIRELRQMWSSFKPMANVADMGTAADTARKMFSATDFERRWKAFQKLSSADAVSAARGAYLGDFLEEVSLYRGSATAPDRLVGIGKAEELWKRNGPYQAAKFRAVLGQDVMNELRDIGRVSNMALGSIAKAEGSATARRMQDLELVNGAMDAAGMATMILKDPSPGLKMQLVGHLLRPVGLYFMADALLNGRTAQALNRLASGQAVTGPRALPAALQQAGGLPGVGRAGLGMVEGTGNALGALLNAPQNMGAGAPGEVP